MQALVGRALSQRAEIKQTQAMTAAALEEHAAAKYGPLIPKVEAHAHWGGLAGGRDGDAGNLGYTSEYLVGLSWRVGPGGLFDRSRVDKEQSRLQQRTLREAGVRDEIARQVVDAATRTQSRADQLRSAERTLELAEQTVGLSRERREYGIAAVVEFIESEQDLTRARSRLLEIIAEYNKAQYDLAGAIGELH